MEGELLQEGEMTILIEHPEHGRTHVYTQDALKEHEAIGWRVVVVEKVEPAKKPLLTLPKKVKK